LNRQNHGFLREEVYCSTDWQGRYRDGDHGCKGREGAIAAHERSGLELVTFDLTVTAAAGSRTQPMNPTLIAALRMRFNETARCGRFSTASIDARRRPGGPQSNPCILRAQTDQAAKTDRAAKTERTAKTDRVAKNRSGR
jgi:hypothetical protein